MSAEKLDLKFNLYSCQVVPQHFVIKRTKKVICRQGGIAVLKATTSAHKRKLANQVDRLDLFCIGCSSFEPTGKCSINTHKMLCKVIL